jgi:TRAP transporter 4TM/12TM fusion protein
MGEHEVKLDNEKLDQMEVKFSNVRSLGGWAATIMVGIAIISSLYHLYTAGWGVPPQQIHLSIHLLFMIVLAFFIYPISKKTLSGKDQGDTIPLYDLAFAILAAGVCLYWIFFYEGILSRSGGESQMDLLMGGLGIILVMEASRRIEGIWLAGLAAIFIVYAMLGPYMPAMLSNPGYNIERIISHLWFTNEGIFGTPLWVSSTYVIVFVIFGSFLKYSGAGEFFINFTYALTGYRKGGPAKTSVLASGLFGMISGSSIANAVTVGSFTIPLMKRAGYRKQFAAALESAASTGGQIMPPVMGAVAFIMVEITGIPYDQIIISAAIPAIAFFFGLWVMAHLEASKSGVKPVPKSELPSAWKMFKEKGYLFLSIVLLLFLLMVVKITVVYAGFFSILAIVALSWVRKDTRMGIKKISKALEEGTRNSVGVAIACACAGIIVGICTLTGLGVALSGLVGAWSGGNLFIALVLTMIVCLVLGTGLPTTATYIVLVIVAAPAIMTMHLPGGALIPLMAVHMFVLYYGVIADITPPIALAAYGASAIAGSDQFWTGMEAFAISLNKLLVPFAFVYSPAILLLGINWGDYWSVGGALFDISTIFIGIYCLQAALSGWMLTRAGTVERIFLGMAAIGLIFPNVPGAIFGIGILLVVLVLHKSRIIAGPERTTMEGFKDMMSKVTSIYR